MNNKIDEYNNTSIITHHGRRYDKLPVKSYYKGRTALFHSFSDVLKDEIVHVGACCAMAFNTDTFKVKLSEYKAKNMTDIWTAKLANDQSVPIIVSAHRKGYLINSEKVSNKDTIHWWHKDNDKEQTKIINSIKFNKMEKQSNYVYAVSKDGTKIKQIQSESKLTRLLSKRIVSARSTKAAYDHFIKTGEVKQIKEKVQVLDPESLGNSVGAPKINESNDKEKLLRKTLSELKEMAKDKDGFEYNKTKAFYADIILGI
jgi:hypothetical protein